MIFETELNISPAALAVFALALYTESLEFTAALFISAAVHEIGHISVICLQKEKILSASLKPWGLCIKCGGTAGERERLLSALAGPAAGAALCLLCIPFSDIDFFALLYKISSRLTVFNLLPCLPLDGGNMISSLLKLFSPEKGYYRTMRLSTNIISVILILAGTLFIAAGRGIFPVFIGVYLTYFNMYDTILQ